MSAARIRDETALGLADSPRTGREARCGLVNLLCYRAVRLKDAICTYQQGYTVPEIQDFVESTAKSSLERPKIKC